MCAGSGSARGGHGVVHQEEERVAAGGGGGAAAQHHAQPEGSGEPVGAEGDAAGGDDR